MSRMGFENCNIEAGILKNLNISTSWGESSMLEAKFPYDKMVVQLLIIMVAVFMIFN